MQETFRHKYYESFKCEKHPVMNITNALNALEISTEYY